ncbi:putative conserved small protein [Rhodospirillaceae bacterium LM-1]|nr:putative conserved small protein [Rhodospirillaceae bacterium LM-1]
MKRKSDFEESSGNVFADIGLSNPEEAMTKAQLAMQIIDIINRRKLSQAEAAALLGIDQPKISSLIHGRLRGFSVERLFRFLNALGREVEIVVRAKKGRSAKPGVRVLAA